MFKSIVPAIVIASAVAAPAFANASENGPLTRAEVKAQLVQLERAGYRPASDQTTYPANIQAAEARVNAEQGVAASSFGGAADGASASGRANRSAGGVSPVDFNRP
ncbi:conserved exported hypothetical protein [Burkholderia sp. 8Y]|uniref:DUF4148 domain-containing protein n=1 Tax=Burkholderia sp. 8Y TaxID=2653133 RepID=UPI0012F0BC68|nr:DUF4148 domain-containing protein [Burkholderia sp. 8Y]VXC35965.1 conserved exported hypothetical protein [Burkholderia sp. 8Y]